MPMLAAIGTKRHKRLIELLVAERKARNLPQEELARRLRQPRSIISRMESGNRRIDVVEFLALAEAIGFDPTNLLRQIQAAGGERQLGRVRLVKVAFRLNPPTSFATKEAARKAAELDSRTLSGLIERLVTEYCQMVGPLKGRR
jgi:transcriptional regulator with XRE-family HTH domain